MATTHKIFIGGGGDDWISHIVKDYTNEYRAKNPGYACPYFSWTDGGGIGDLLESLTPDTDVTVIGHSYGGDTAFSEIQRGRPVNTLISIDPVGRFRTPWTVVRARCYRWLNVRAQPSSQHRTFDDTIAGIGGKYPPPPIPGQVGAPDHSLIVDATHGAFRTMMRAAASDGVGGRSLLGGNSVA